MSKPAKILSFIVGLVLLTLTVSVMLGNALAATLPAPLAFIGQPSLPAPLNGWVATYLFWLSASLTVLILIGFLALLFWPRTKAIMDLDQGDGQLALSSAAVEGLVKSTVEDHGYMTNPKVKAKLYRRRIKVMVTGDIIPRQDAVKRASAIQAAIERHLKDFLGVTKPLRLTVHVAQASQTSASPAKSRVL